MSASDNMTWTTLRTEPIRYTCNWCHETFEADTQHDCVNDPPKLGKRLAKVEKFFENVCLEHDDCRQSLLSHACKHAPQRQSEEKK